MEKTPIQKIAILIVITEEYEQIEKAWEMELEKNKKVTEQMHGAAKVYDVKIGKLNVSIVKFTKDTKHETHKPGYQNAAVIADRTMNALAPDLVVTFGTSGSPVNKCSVGDVTVNEASLYIDVFRAGSFEKYWAGVAVTPLYCPKEMVKGLSLKTGWVGSQCSYRIYDEETALLQNLPITNLDMEANSISRTCFGRDVPVMSVKLTSNSVYLDDHIKQEKEYRENKGKETEHLMEALKTLKNILLWQEKNGKKITKNGNPENFLRAKLKKAEQKIHKLKQEKKELQQKEK